MKTIQIKETKQLVQSVDNSMDEERRFDITADVTISGGIVTNISMGRVASRENKGFLADFSDYGNLSSNIQSTSDYSKAEVFMAISEFCDAVKEELKN